jgi:hypothetical protein
MDVSPGTVPHDGDTFRVGGQNARLFGADAFELDQTGTQGGIPVPLGAQAQQALRSDLTGGGRATATGAQTYGRPVMSLSTARGDAGANLIRSGLALPTPTYLASDPARMTDYIAAQRGAIAAERGAYAGQYQTPQDYRRQGAAAPMRGKIAMTPVQRSEYTALLRNPKTTEAQLSAWMATQGQAATNVGNILSFARQNPTAKPATYFQQQDAVSHPVLPDGPGVVARTLAAANEGLADTLGAPVDLSNAGLKLLGLPMSDDPFGGSTSIRNGLHALGIGQDSEAFAPRSTAERYAQSIARGVGQVALPLGGMLAAGVRVGAAGAGLASQEGGALAQGLRRMVSEAAARPGVALAGEVGGGVGAGVGGQAARDAFPGDPYADMAGQMLGGIGGGVAAGLSAARMPAPPHMFGATRRMARPAAPIEAEAIGGQPVQVTPMAAPIESAAVRSPIPVEPNAFGGRTMASAIEPGPSLTGQMMDEVGNIGMTSQSAGDIPPPPAGFVMDSAPAAGLSNAPPPPPGFVLDSDLPMPTNGPDQMGADGLAALARTIDPRDVRPLPANTIGSLDEAMRANPGTLRDMVAPDERAALPSYRPSPGAPMRKDPIDLVGWLRTQGGIRDQRGELRAAGIDNKARPIEFAKSEGFLGRLVNDDGMSFDDAARAAHEAGFFPDLPDRPTVNEFIDAVRQTHDGGPGRMFHPDDYDAIDAYRGAQSQRYAVEQAEQNGAPLAEDVGQPVDMADLDANQPPATAYEDLRAPGGRVGNIDVSKLTTGEDIGRALATVDERFGGFDAARRGRVSQAETAALANEMGMTPDMLLKRRRGQALNAEQALAARQLLAKSGEHLVDLAGKAVGGSDESVAEFHRALLRHAAIQEQVSGATAEAGRTLAQFRMAADAKVVPAQLFQQVIASAGGRKSVEDAAETLLEMQRLTGDPSKLNAFALKAAKPGAKDKLIEWWYNSLLSGPQTHVVNTVSNGLTSILQVPEHAVASAIGKARSAVTGSSDRVLSSEVGARAFGLIKGVREGLDAFRYSFRTGIVPDHVAKVESALQEAIPGRLGKIVRTPTRLLAAEDEMFKAIARRMELNSQAVRQATNEKLTGAALRGRIAELSAEPTDEMMANATKYARYVTFQNPLGPGLQAISNATNRSIPFKMVLPFLRTPTNIFSFAAERSPLAPFVRGWRSDVAAGGARRDLALARAAMGSGLGLMISQWALNGDITGSRPRDRATADMMQADGWQPYSIRVGGRYYSYQRLDPVAMTLGFAADLATGIEKMNRPDSETAGDEMLAMLMQQLKDKSFLSGISDVSNAIDSRNGNLGERLASYAGRQAGSLLVPTLAAQVARTVDPVQRDTRDIAGPILSRIPGLSSRLTPRTNSWGHPIVNEGGVGPDLLSPMRMRTLQRDPLTAEMLRVGAPMGEPSRTVAGRKLTRPEMNAYKLATGNIVRDQLSGMIGTPEWRGLPVEQQRAIIDKTVTASRKRARIGMFGGGKAIAPPLPLGFVLDRPPPLPPGFVMDAPPPLPPGFVLDR